MTVFPLISVADLADHLEDPDWRVVDCRHNLAAPAAGEAAYQENHIPGAVFMHMDRDLSGPKTGHNGRHPLPEVALLVRRLEMLGIGNQTRVVAYDDCGGMMAARLWWLLRWLGHGAVSVLDGGFPAWVAAGQPVDGAAPQSRLGHFTARVQPWVVLASKVLAGLGHPGRLILDARAPDRFHGENETMDPVGGHIPGARNRFFRNNLTPDGHFKPAHELQREFQEILGALSPEQVIHQCGSGVSACHNLLAMELAGLPGSKLYAGSWSEWCSDPARPVEK